MQWHWNPFNDCHDECPSAAPCDSACVPGCQPYLLVYPCFLITGLETRGPVVLQAVTGTALDGADVPWPWTPPEDAQEGAR